MSTLATLARVARRDAEDIERRLAASEARLRLVRARLAAHDRAVANESALARQSLEGSFTFGAYAQHALEQRRLIVAEEQALALETEALRDTLRDAFIELKKIEILIEQGAARDAAEENRLDQIAMDDIAANMMRQKS